MTDGNESAMPMITTERQYDEAYDNRYSFVYSEGGLSKREYFVAAVVQSGVGVPADYMTRQRELDRRANPHNETDKPTPRSEMQIAASYYIAKADALIDALNAKN